MSESSPNPRPFDDDLAVVIGINQYQNGIPELKTARFDAERLADILETKHDYQVKRLIDKEATLDNIWNYLKTELSEKIKQQDKNKRVRLLFYFAGHGTAPQGEAGDSGYLLPQDAHRSKHDKYLSMKEIHDVLSQLGCHHLLIILDCCYAGAFRFGTRELGSSPEELSKERYARYQDRVGQVITSAAYDQKALDILEAVANLDGNRGRFGNSNHSPFAGLLLKALEEGDADFTKDGITTVTELNLHLSEKLRELTQNQSQPQISRSWCLPKLDKGEFFFQTGEFDPTKLPEAINLNKDNNPYRGLESFEEAHSRLFFGRSKEIDILYNKLLDSNVQPLTVVLGVSGAGKSSLVKAGLISKLRENPTQWRILEPIRPGATAFKALARAVLPLTLENSDPDFEPLKQLDELLQKARRKNPNDNTLNDLFAKWRRTAPEDKLLLIIKHFERLKELCGEQEEKTTLVELRKMGLSRSRLVLDNFDELKQNSNPAEHKQLLQFKEQEQVTAFYEKCSEEIQDWSEKWQQDGEKFGNFIIEKCFTNKKILLVIDQFEELITQCSQEERKQFLNALQAALKSCSQQLRLVLTLRDDFRHDFENSEQLQEYWKKACSSVAAMGREQLRQVIEQPALAQVLYFEEKNGESLVNQLLDDIGDTSGVLPLLSFTLSELYCKYVEKARKNDRTLKWEDYEELGNVTKALTGKATEEHDNLKYDLSEEGKANKVEVDSSEVERRQKMLRWVMLRMVNLDGGVPTKQAIVDTELIYIDPKTNERRKLVINRFVDARLFVRGTNQEGQKYVEPAHDVLIREWGLLQKWIAEEQENLVLQKRLTTSTLDWNSQGCTEDSPLLWNQDNSRIERLKEIANSDNCWLNKLELRFFEASMEERDRQARERLEKEIELYTELSQKLFIGNERLDAIVKMIEAGRLLQKGSKITDYKEFEFLVTFNQLLRECGEINSINVGDKVNNFSCNQTAQVVATVSGYNDEICFWDWKGNLINCEQSQERFYDQAFSPDGKILATGGDGGIIKFYSSSSDGWRIFHEIKGDIKEHDIIVFCVKFSPDGTFLVSVDSGGNMNFWSREGKHLANIPPRSPKYAVGDVTFSQNVNLFAFVSHNKDTGEESIVVKKYQIYEHKEYQTCSILCIKISEFDEFDAEHEGEISAIGFSIDGRTLVSTGKDGKLRLWSVKSEGYSKDSDRLYTDKEASISSVSFNPNRPDGRIVASSHTSGVINIWDTSVTERSNKLQKLYKLEGHKDEITRISFTSDGSQLLSSSDDGTVKFWSFTDRFEGYTRAKVQKVSFSKDNQIVATAHTNGNLLFWQSTGKLIETLEISIDNENELFDIQWTCGNEIILAVAKDGQVEINLYSCNRTFLLYRVSEKCRKTITSLNLSPKADILLITNDDNTIDLWQIDREPLNINLWKTLTGQQEKITAVTFSKDGQFFASGGADGTVKLWRIEDNQALGTISNVEGSSSSGDSDEIWCKKATGKIHALKFNHEDKTIVSIDETGRIETWSIGGYSLPGINLLPKQALDIEVEAADFSFNGKGVAIATCLNKRADSYRRIEVYNLDIEALTADAHKRIQNYVLLNNIKL